MTPHYSQIQGQCQLDSTGTQGKEGDSCLLSTGHPPSLLNALNKTVALTPALTQSCPWPRRSCLPRALVFIRDWRTRIPHAVCSLVNVQVGGTLAVKESFTFYWTDEKTKAWREAETTLEWGLPLRWTRKSNINETWNNSHNYLSVYNMPTVDKVLSYCGDIPSAPQLRDVAREITRPSVCRECHTVQRNMDTSCISYVAQARDD